MLSLYHSAFSVCAVKVRMQLAQKTIPWESRIVDLRADDQKTPAFLALNPKGLVPVLKHDEAVITESNIIMEYIEEAFAGTTRLLPDSPVDRAKVRAWMKQLDTGLHLDIATISMAISYNGQLPIVDHTPGKAQAFFNSIPDRGMRSAWQNAAQGIDSPGFRTAIDAWIKVLGDMNKALGTSDYLVGDQFSLADFALMPYVCRFEHLQLSGLWDGAPDLAAWFQRMKTTVGYKDGFEKWFVPSVLELMKENGSRARSRVLNLADSSCLKF